MGSLTINVPSTSTAPSTSAILQPPTGGPSSVVYSDAGRTTPVTVPAQVSGSATYWLQDGTYTITIVDTANSVLYAGSVTVAAAIPVVLTVGEPSPYLTQAAATGTYGQLAGPNTWAGTQNFAGATVTGISGSGTLPSEGGNWATSTAYTPGNVVTQAGQRYECIVAHTSGTFSTDIAAVKWVSLDAVQALAVANNLSDLASASTARTNLGLGSAATANTIAFDAAGAATAAVTGLAPLASPTFTGTPAAPTAAALTSSTQIATTAYADSAVAVAKALLAPLASPALTGTPSITTTVSSAPLGSELTSGSFSFTGATTASGNGGAFAGVGSMTMTVTIPGAGNYQLVYTRSGANGNTTHTLGNSPAVTQPSSQSAGALLKPTAGGAVTLTISGDSGMTGVTITNVSLKQITGTVPAALSVTGPSVTTEVRALSGNNSAMGYLALQSNTTGSNNSAMGYLALQSNTTGSGNSAMGQQALQSNTTGSGNSAMGHQALYSPAWVAANATVTGIQNTAIGRGSGASSAIDPSNIVAVGYYAIASTNAVAVGSGASATAAGSIAIGKDSTGTSATSTTTDLAVIGTSLTTTQVAKLSISNATTGTTSPSAGGAGALPGTPTGYITVTIGGASRQLAYY